MDTSYFNTGIYTIRDAAQLTGLDRTHPTLVAWLSVSVAEEGLGLPAALAGAVGAN